MLYLGEISALITSLSFAFTATFFTFAGRLVGSGVVNRTRLVFGLGMLLITHQITQGSWLPRAGWEPWLWLSLSGVIGLTLGDAFLFQAFLWIGPRLSMLMMSLAPVLAALLAWLFLGETLTGGQITGILLTIGGIAWVIAEQNGQNDRRVAGSSTASAAHPNYKLGILFGIGAATGQAVGLILSKKGLAHDFPALSGNVIRMIAATSSIWLYTLFRKQMGETLQQLTAHPRVLLFILGGAIFGPLIGVSFSLLAVQKTEVGIASTLIALTPIFMLPVGALIFKEKFGWQAIVGTLLAMVGVALLFLV
ncbi:MAG TPA: DMT family transporter [Anaerolineales bacterium]|nr:DMT family transporter [Anaerolineales bacterium]